MTPNMDSAILPLIRQGVDYRIKIKTRALQLTVRPLAIIEEDQIAQEVVTRMHELPEHARTSIRETLLLTTLKLEMASTSDVGANDPKLTVAELERMLPSEIDSLFKQWVAGCDKLNPMLEEISAVQVSEMIEGLKKNSSARVQTLTELSFFQLVAISQRLISEDSPVAS